MWSTREIIGVILAGIAGGILAPIIVKWVSKKKGNRKRKFSAGLAWEVDNNLVNIKVVYFK